MLLLAAALIWPPRLGAPSAGSAGVNPQASMPAHRQLSTPHEAS